MCNFVTGKTWIIGLFLFLHLKNVECYWLWSSLSQWGWTLFSWVLRCFYNCLCLSCVYFCLTVAVDDVDKVQAGLSSSNPRFYLYLHLILSFPCLTCICICPCLCLTVANDDVDKVQAGLSARLGREGKTVMQNGGGQHTARPGLLKHNWANKREQATTQTHLLH